MTVLGFLFAAVSVGHVALASAAARRGLDGDSRFAFAQVLHGFAFAGVAVAFLLVS